MRNILILLVLALVSSGVTAAQDDGDCLEFTDTLLGMGETVGENIPLNEDETGPLVEKYLALMEVRQFLNDSLNGTIPCHEAPAHNLYDATLNYQDYITLRLGQKLDKTFPDIASLLDTALEAANSQYDTYRVFWDPPDA